METPKEPVTTTKVKRPLPDFLSHYEGIEGDVVPTIAELHRLYGQYGEVTPNSRRPFSSFSVERVGKSFEFLTRAAAWDCWLDRREYFERLVKPAPL